MPTYEYQCQECEHFFEKFQSITAKPVKKCPQCGKMKVKRLLGTGAGIIFKGTGFYETDYRSESYKKSAESEKPKAESGEKTKDSSTKSGDTAAKSDSAQAGKNQGGSKKTAEKK